MSSPGLARVSKGHFEFSLDGDPIAGGNVKKNGAVGIRGIPTIGLAPGIHTFEASYSDASGVFRPGTAQIQFQIR